ncbi:phBC6A51 family helix-turn-helix protein [Streptococcus sp. H31]|uniref:phBC6A51 family helix-turn-helix protein n=1 Tax=Streptococcus huangxiaojuni TaxID=3237239 RepID=UPI0034A53F3A
MITNKQRKAIDLLFEGKLKDYEVAAEVKVTPQTLVSWKKKPEFVEALREKSMNYAQTTMISPLLKNQFKLALAARSEMVRFSATKDLLDRLNFTIGEQNINLKAELSGAIAFIEDVPEND